MSVSSLFGRIKRGIRPSRALSCGLSCFCVAKIDGLGRREGILESLLELHRKRDSR